MSQHEENKTDRRTFLGRALGAGLACCGAACAVALPARAGAGAPPGTAGWVDDLERRMVKGAESAGSMKAQKAGHWIKSMMTQLDDNLDPETRIKIMQACGRACYLRAFGVAPATQGSREDLDGLANAMEKAGRQVTREGDRVSFIFNWGRNHQNPYGLTIRDGYCMCPLVESGPPDLSPTYCYCSTGYVRETFARATGLPVQVELLDSLKRGGKDCVFRVTVSLA